MVVSRNDLGSLSDKCSNSLTWVGAGGFINRPKEHEVAAAPIPSKRIEQSSQDAFHLLVPWQAPRSVCPGPTGPSALDTLGSRAKPSQEESPGLTG